MEESKNEEYILIADDDIDDIEILTTALNDLKVAPKVVTAKNGKGVIEYLQSCMTVNKSKVPCVVIMDMNMPLMDGRETVVAIKGLEVFKGLPIILYSTSKNKTDELFAQKWQVRYLEKPDTVDGLNKLANLIVEACKKKEA